MNARKKAVILLSGGLDSATCLAIAKNQGFDLYAMSFQYGQRHTDELECAKWQANHADVTQHHIVTIDLRAFQGSALTDASLAVPKHRPESEMQDSIPITYVPARNTIFLSFALGWAEAISAHDIYIGVNAVDYSGYPDCRPEFIQAFQHMANVATKEAIQGRPVNIHTPLIHWTKSQIIQCGLQLGVDYQHTLTCYDPIEGEACGACDACTLRLNGFEANLTPDPARYHSR